MRAIPERKLAAIMLADIAGFSALMEKDEAGTFDRVRALREQLAAPKVSEHGGRIIKTTGDGFLAEFPSATAALQCAIVMQRQNHADQAGLPAEDRIHMRMGINVGDVIIDGDDVAGDGVVIAARLEPLAPLDGICVSSTVREHIRQELGIEYQDLGDQQVKNISRPIRAYRIDLAGSGGVIVKPADASSRPPKKAAMAIAASIAVIAAAGIGIAYKGIPPAKVAPYSPEDLRMTFAILPLSAPDGDKAAAQFANSVTEALIDRQTMSPWSRVVSRESVTEAQKKFTSARDLGQALHVRYLVRGNVTRSGDTFATTLSVVEGDTDQVLGTRDFKWPVARPLSIWPDLDQAMGLLAGKGYMKELERTKRKKPEDLDVRDLTYLANHAWFNDKASYDVAMPLLRRALAEAPDDRLALLVVARINLCECRKKWAKNPAEQERIGEEAVDKYLSRFSDDRQMIQWKIYLNNLRGRFADSLVLVDRLLEKAPSDPGLLRDKAYLLLKLGNARDALPLIESALREEPSLWNRAEGAAVHYALGHYVEAAELAQKAIAEIPKKELAEPEIGDVLLIRAAAEARLGHTRQAAAVMDDFNALVPDARTVSAIRKWQDPRADLAGFEPLYEGLRAAGMKD